MTLNDADRNRCEWANSGPLMLEYHDREWGVPIHDVKKLYEFLVLEGAQAGLNWQLILKKRENYRKAFSGFDPNEVARYDETDEKRLLNDVGIVRNRLKINAAIVNARRILEIQRETGSFDAFIWGFVGNKPLNHHFRSLSEIPATTEDSDAMSRELKKRGFKFVGSTICYAFMQAVGMVNDHTVNCFRHKELMQTNEIRREKKT